MCKDTAKIVIQGFSFLIINNNYCNRAIFDSEGILCLTLTLDLTYFQNISGFFSYVLLIHSWTLVICIKHYGYEQIWNSQVG